MIENENVLVLKRFCGDEYYPVESASWGLYNDNKNLSVEIYCGLGNNLHEDTEELQQEPGFELYFNVESEIKKGTILDEKDLIKDNSSFYYCEFIPLSNVKLEVLEKKDDNLLLKIQAECCDVNYYDGSKGNDIIELKAWISKE